MPLKPPLRSRHPYDPLPSYGRTRIRLMGKSKKRVGGNPPKSRKNKTVKKQSPVLETCGICLETMATNTKKTLCGHKFHAECLDSVCKKSLRMVCPLCRRDITKDCVRLQPPIGIFMPEHRINNIIEYEQYQQSKTDTVSDQEKLDRMKKILDLLKYPKKRTGTPFHFGQKHVMNHSIVVKL